MTIKYTDEQKYRIRGMIEALQGAKPHLRAATLVGSGICGALDDWFYNRPSDDFQRDYDTLKPKHRDARSLIRRALGNYLFLEDWQSQTHVIWLRARRYADRLRWLDQLIHDCEMALEE